MQLCTRHFCIGAAAFEERRRSYGTASEIFQQYGETRGHDGEGRRRGDEDVLDCGCGGGANLAQLLRLLPEGRVTGLDYSPISVEKAREVNRAAIDAGRCTVVQGNVLELPFESSSFDVVTAFETVYFWPELVRCFAEIHRVLKPGGVFMITNEATGRTKSHEDRKADRLSVRAYRA